MKKRALLLASLLLGLFSTLILIVPCWSQSGAVAYTR
jgi:hypothetical protein